MTLDVATEDSVESAEAVFAQWLNDFSSAMESRSVDRVLSTVTEDCYWRDLLALTWDLGTFHGRPAIAGLLNDTLDAAGASSFRIDAGHAPRLVSGDNGGTIEGFYLFETPTAWCRGVAKLVQVDGVWTAASVMTGVEDIKGHERAIGARRPTGPRHLADASSKRNWKDRRNESLAYADREPDVVIIGAGQGGLAVAANLGLMGLDALILEKSERVGDGWRKRYHSLVLHDPVWADHLPYLPFPSAWPIFSAKDKIADWFEFYAEVMELNVWTNAEMYDSSYDEAAGVWTVKVHTAEGKRLLHPKDVILATGAAAEINLPDIAGRDAFGGISYHSSAHVSGADWSGKKAVIIGAGNSAHDIAQDLYEAGAETTMVQRSSTHIISQENGIPAIFGANFTETGPPTEYADLLASATPWSQVLELAVEGTRQTAIKDVDLLDSLKAVGFQLNDGPGGSGLLGGALQHGGGYYINVGCSQLIADQRVKLASGAGLAEFTPTGVKLEDGRELEADVVVLATGYKNMRETGRRLFGDDLADRCPDVLGIGADGEIGGLYRRTGVPGFWFMAGPLAWVRIYSKHLALQIVALQKGVIAR